MSDEHIKEKLDYYYSQHFKDNYSDKWVLLIDSSPNYELPFFIDRKGYTTDTVKFARTFDSEAEAIEGVAAQIKLGRYTDIKPFPLRNIEGLIEEITKKNIEYKKSIMNG